MEHYDLAIIGGGPGGYSAAIKAAGLGAKAALVEKGKLGGTCLHRGCIPTKSLNKSAGKGEPFADAFKRKDKVVADLEKQVKSLVKGIDLYSGKAYLESSTEISIDGKDKIVAGKIIIATGSSPLIPSKFDIDREKIMSSDEILRLKGKPESILIAGGGYIGCEFANIFADYGVEVKLVELLPKILATEDEDAVKLVLKSFKKRNVDVYTDTRIDSVSIKGGKVESKLSDGKVLETELVLMAIGRKPNSEDLGLDNIGIGLGDDGAIKVDGKMETNARGIYAIGDVADKEFRLAHVAEKEGAVAAENALGASIKMDYSLIPTAVFTSPEIASVGREESKLKEDNEDYVVGKFWYKGNPMARCEGKEEGFAKLMADKNTHEVLGATIVGESASDLIHEIVLSIGSGARVEGLADAVYFHPSRSEVIKKAAEAALKKL